MAVTRSVTKKKIQDECSRKRAKALEESSKSPWSNLIDEILILIIMRLGVTDFNSFIVVCKNWTSIALSSKNMFLSTREPLSLSFSTKSYKKYCHFEDLEKRRFKTSLPHSAGRTCVGVTCGYIIFYGTKYYDFWLVNPMTRHELHFPGYYNHHFTDLENARGILVFSPSISGWVFVLFSSYRLSFCLAGGKEACSSYKTTDIPIHDIHFYKGKIYALTTGSRLCEVRLNPTQSKLSVTLLGTNIMNSDLSHPVFTSCDGKLYVIGYNKENVCTAMEVDVDQIKLGCPFTATEKYACFVNVLKSGRVGKVGLWADLHEQYKRFNHKGRLFNSKMWYFPHDCLTVNRLEE